MLVLLVYLLVYVRPFKAIPVLCGFADDYMSRVICRRCKFTQVWDDHRVNPQRIQPVQ